MLSEFRSRFLISQAEGHAHENLAVLRPISLNLLCQEQSSRVGIRAKRLKASWLGQQLSSARSGWS